MNNIAELQPTKWRLLDTGLCDGATNMAIDEAILQSVGEGKSLPTLRFYGWQPPCVSIGYSQSFVDDIDLDLCRRMGYSWVRRPTGGLAILHIDELTYSVVAPLSDPRVAGDIITSYRKISLGLVAGLRSIGCDVIQAELLQTDYNNKSAACFEVPSHYEISALGRKLVGSAQVRRKGVVLQHGALPLKGDVSRLAEVLAIPKRQKDRLKRKLQQRAIALDEVLGRIEPYEKVVEAISNGFRETFKINFEYGTLSKDELSKTSSLKKRYSGEEWTIARKRPT